MFHYPFNIIGENMKKATKSNKPVNLRTFRQLKDTVDTKRGSLWQSDVNKSEPYHLITPETYKGVLSGAVMEYTIPTHVESQPEWFAEVFPSPTEWFTKRELEQIQTILSDPMASMQDRTIIVNKAVPTVATTTPAHEVLARKPRASKYSYLKSMVPGETKVISRAKKVATSSAASSYGLRAGRHYSVTNHAQTKARVLRVR
jgi:hypothetical protein